MLRALAAIFFLTGPTAWAQPPAPVRDAVPGRIAAWERADLLAPPGMETAVVYDQSLRRLCSRGHLGAWRVAVVAGGRRTADRRLVRSMCGNAFRALRAGRLTDGRHAEIAVTILLTPSIGERAWILRVVENRLRVVRIFHADRVKVQPGRVIQRWLYAARSPAGVARQAWVFERGAYRLQRRG
jgi:hypothetical protein